MSIERIESTEKDGILVLRILPEELRETDVCYATRDQMLAAIDPSTVDRVVIDMANTHFIGSIGLLAFLAVRRTIPSSRIIMCNLDDPIRNMFILCRLVSDNESADAPFQVRASLDDALAELAN